MKDYYQSGTNYINKIDCPHVSKCTSANTWKCHSCKHNRGKRDYYEPEPYRPIPWIAEPWYPPGRNIWYICRPKADIKLNQFTARKPPYFLR